MPKKQELFTNPYVWGPDAWHFLHCVTLTAPEKFTPDDKKLYKNFFKSLGDVLPCKICRKHYKQWWSNETFMHNIHSREDMVRWLIDFHNQVNKRLDKPVLSYRQAMKIIKNRCLYAVAPLTTASCKHSSK